MAYQYKSKKEKEEEKRFWENKDKMKTLGWAYNNATLILSDEERNSPTEERKKFEEYWFNYFMGKHDDYKEEIEKTYEPITQEDMLERAKYIEKTGDTSVDPFKK